MKNSIDLFLDSGAFSAFSKNTSIGIDDYIKFIKENEKYLAVYANLDVIGDPKATLENQRIMEGAGLSPLPCFHQGEPISYLKDYVEQYDYIAIGGLASKRFNYKTVTLNLDKYFGIVCNEKGMPKTKVHGFGMTSLKLMLRYPWYSVDSTSWVAAGINGGILVPKKRNGRYNYLEDCLKVSVSDRSPNKAEEGKHFHSFSVKEKQTILDYVKLKGFTIEELATDYKKRDEINIIYYLDLEKAIPKWPWKFKSTAAKGFQL